MAGKDSGASDQSDGRPRKEGVRFTEVDLESLEAEVFLMGMWKNFEELEEVLSIPELELILKTYRETRKREMHFQASLQGVDMYKQEVETRKRELAEEAWQEAYGESIPTPEIDELFTLTGVEKL